MIPEIGQHVVCKYAGANNGDLIVGRIVSLAPGSRVVLRNMLTGSTSIKLARVLMCRNVPVSASQAAKVVAAFNTGGKTAARRVAVDMARDAATRMADLTAQEIRERVSRLEKELAFIRRYVG